MPGGLLALVCYGNENVIVNGNPEVTWFYKSFLRHTHFSQEAIQIPLDGPNLLLMDSPILLKAKIPRQGDLLSDLVLRINLPDIFSKAYFQTDASGNPIKDAAGNFLLDRAFEFKWVRKIGAQMIQKLVFTVGGQVIQEFNSEWIIARALLDLDTTQYDKWRSMVGDVPELFDPANGIYADFSTGQPLYPNVILWQNQRVQNNSPSIPGRILRIPLGLWFSDFIQNSLPLVALQYHDAEIQITMRPIRDLYTVQDPSGVQVRYGSKLGPYYPTDMYPDQFNTSGNPYGPVPKSMFDFYTTDTDIRGSMRFFLTDINTSPDFVPFQEGWPLNATLEATYTFVRQEEQQIFVKKTTRYNIRQVQNFPFYGISTRNTYRLDVHNIATRIVMYARRSDAIPYRNQATNVTNWIDPRGSGRPFVVPANFPVSYPNQVNSNGAVIPLGRSGINLPGIQRKILRNAFFTANGNSLFDSQDSGYFTEYVPYRYLKGASAPFQDYGLAAQSEMWPIYTYSFALHSSDIEQPTGTLNTSRINRLEVDVDVEPIPTLAGYAYELQVFVETLNFLEISSGLGGLKFAM